MDWLKAIFFVIFFDIPVDFIVPFFSLLQAERRKGLDFFFPKHCPKYFELISFFFSFFQKKAV